MPVSFLKAGRMTEKRPEASVDVVDASVMVPAA
jgi:hypothetical protein